MSTQLENLLNSLETLGAELATKLVAAIAFWVIGRWLIALAIRLINGGLERQRVDAKVGKYVRAAASALLNVGLVLGILGYFGVETTSFAALLAGVGLAIGAAWSGLLAHFAAGVFLLLLRPFKVGDFISAGDVSGRVKEIGLFATKLLTPDNVLTTVGNNRILSGDIQNFSAQPLRRVDRTALIAAGVEPLGAIEKLRVAVAAIPHVSMAMPPEIDILDFRLEGTVLSVRPYTPNDHYWEVYFATNAAIARVAAENRWPVAAAVHRVLQG